MVIDKIENSNLYEGLSPLIKKAFAYIKETNFNTLELGKHTIDGENLFAILMEYDTKSIDECKLEAHRKYIDVQYIISGSELIGVTPLVSQTPSLNYNDKDDYALYDNNASLVRLDAQQFAIFFPDDLHMPGVKIDSIKKVKKVVVKVKI